MMKNLLLLSVILGLTIDIQAQYTTVPDSNFEQALINDGVDSDGVINGQILTTDAEAKTGQLSLDNQNISDLTGLEAFINISAITVSFNNITTLDVTSNIAIYEIIANGCPNLTNLNLSGLPGISYVEVRDNALSTIDVSDNTSLETLNIRNNNISSLDLSNNPNLISLDAKNNNLNFLDVRNGNNLNITYFNSDFNSDLTCIYVDDSSASFLDTWSVGSESTFVETESECNTLELNDIAIDDLQIYPNPAITKLHIVLDKFENVKVEIMSISGILVQELYLKSKEDIVDISHLHSGMYLLKVSESTGNRMTLKKLLVK